MRLSINVSARNLQDRRFPSSVLKALDEASLAPDRLELEITESAIASEPERSLFADQCTARGRRAGGDRRLRHRLLVVQHAPRLHRRSFEDRRQLRRRHRPQPTSTAPREGDRRTCAGAWASRPSPRVSRPSSRGSPSTTWAATLPRATSSADRCHFPSWSNGSTSANRCRRWSTCRHDHRRCLDRCDLDGSADGSLACAAGEALAPPGVARVAQHRLADGDHHCSRRPELGRPAAAPVHVRPLRRRSCGATDTSRARCSWDSARP